MNFHEHFDAVFVPNLPNRPDRRDRMERIFKELDIKFQFFRAINGWMFADLYHRLRKLPDFDFCAPGYLGAGMTHLSIFDYALNMGYKRIAVVEDDVKVHKCINSLAMDMMPHAPPDWDMLYFSYIPLTDDFTMWDYNTLTGRFVYGSPQKGFFRSKNLCSLMGYAVTERMMRHLVNYFSKNFSMALDIHIIRSLQDNPEWNIYGMNPQLFIGSDVHSDGTGYNLSVQDKSIDLRASQISDYMDYTDTIKKHPSGKENFWIS